VEVLGTVPVGTWPYFAAFDGGNGYVYVPNVRSDSVSVIDGATNGVVATVPVGTYPYFATYDSKNGYIYVPDYGSAGVSVIDGATDALVTTVSVGSSPLDAIYDSGNGDVYVPNSGSANVSVIDGTSNTVVATISVGSGATFATYDTGNGYVYVANQNSNNVSVIGGRSIVTTVPVGALPEMPGYDSGNGDVYVPNAHSDSVSVIDGASNTVVATVPVGSTPNGATYDDGNGFVYVANSGSGSVSVIDGANNTVAATVPVGSTPYFATYDKSDGYVYVPNYGSTTVSVISGTTDAVVATVPVGSTPHFATYDSANGDVYVTNEGSANVSVLGVRTYAVAFTETGLPASTQWWVNVTGEPSRVSTNSTITLTLMNQSYTYAVSTVDKTYQAAGGSFTVNGTPVAEMVAFARVTYGLTFAESGIAFAGETEWNVTVNGIPRLSSTGVITFRETNGTYRYGASSPGWQPDPATGSVTVNGGDQSVPIAFTEVTYRVTFTESGLPGATSWNGTLGGGSEASRTTTMTFNEPNGTYNFGANSSGWQPSPPRGTVTVAGENRSVSISFTQVTYNVTFTESGLPGGASWSVTLGGRTLASSVATITFHEPNGTYSFTVPPVPGYGTSASRGSVLVKGQEASRAIGFNSTSMPTFLGLPQAEGDWLLGGVFAAIAVMIGGMLLLRKRRANPGAGGRTPSARQPPAPAARAGPSGRPPAT
jgi:YVTN family beta-propeller protein